MSSHVLMFTSHDIKVRGGGLPILRNCERRVLNVFTYKFTPTFTSEKKKTLIIKAATVIKLEKKCSKQLTKKW